MDDLPFLPATTLAARIRAGELSPVTLCEAYLKRIHALNPSLNAFRLIAPDRALAAAEAAQRQLRAGIDLGPLHGIPYVTKDLFDVAGLPTTAGSRTLEGNVAARDATVTRRLAAAGMVLLGKTNTVEFAFGSVGVNHSHGTPRNPWAKRHHVPGGSSSGSAVAVAAGLAALGTGTDTACSVRTPAALCGIVGLKTTVGRISRHGVYPLSESLDSVGALARSVADAAHMFTAMQGADAGDETTHGIGGIDVLATLHCGARGLRVAFAEGFLFEDLDPEVERAVRDSAGVFRDLGAHVSAVDFAEAREVMARPSVISQVEAYAINAARLEQQPGDLDPVVRDRMRPGGEVRAVDYRNALRALLPLRERVVRRFVNADVLLAPTCMTPAKPLDDVDADFDTYMKYAGSYLRNCFVGNLLNLCAVTVPCGFTSAGLPVGLMIYAAPFGEDKALRIAQAFEQATPWHTRHPDLCRSR
ncbi:amidase [Aquisalimonas sp.]|uniref:amidase n=1 Tax=Aquisalimonas sp. TaxID=1872621 RepID=UPI0025BAAE8B|nr:amidase [Aquisalimonas sp.]